MALPLVREAGDPQAIVPVLDVRMEIDLDRGRSVDAVPIARELLETLTRRPARLDALVSLALGAPGLDMADELRAILGMVRQHSRWPEAARLILDGQLVEAADLLAEIGDLPHEARVRMAASERFRKEGSLAEADDQAELALAFWRSVGANRYISAVAGNRSAAS
jgi:hypothetical protein